MKAVILAGGEGIRLVFLLGNGIGGLHRVEEMLLVLLDVEYLEELRCVLRDLAVVDDALQFARPGIAEFLLRHDLDRHPPPGDVLTIPNVSERAASAVRQKFQSVELFCGSGVHGRACVGIGRTRRTNGIPAGAK